MALYKQMIAPNGATVEYHKILKIETTEDLSSLLVHVGSWPNYQTFLNHNSAIWNSHVLTPIGNLLDISQNNLLISEEFTGSTIMQDIEPVADTRARKWFEIKNARDAQEFGGFYWDNSKFDSDLISQSRIQGAVILAMQNPSFTIDWTLKDNSVRTLSAADMLAVGQALATHVEIAHTKARTIRTQLDAATTIPEVEAIFW